MTKTQVRSAQMEIKPDENSVSMHFYSDAEKKNEIMTVTMKKDSSAALELTQPKDSSSISAGVVKLERQRS